MKPLLMIALPAVLVAVVLFAASVRDRAEAADASGTLVVHDVYFQLKDNSPAARKKLVDACKKYLKKHDGVVYFAAGTVHDDLKREVNDRDWDVGLHVVFKDKASHDKYQDAPTHKSFIEENKENWKKVRVFDTAAQE
jgi:hypothetical protein